MFRVQNEAGFTMVELLLTLSLFAVLLIPMYSLLYTGIRTYRQLEEGINHQQNLRIGMEEVTRDLRECLGLVGTAGIAGLNERSLLLKAGDQSVVRYYLSEQDLRWAKMKPGEAKFHGHNPVAGGISYLRFIYNKVPLAESTQVTIVMEGIDNLGRQYNLRSTVYLRLD